MDSVITGPAISVIMPVYNAAPFLREAIDSILNQAFTNYEFFIIDDASTDNSAAIIKSYTDKRIQFIQKPLNTGYTDSLNMAIPLANGKYIARMDADDISLPQRFTQQYRCMEDNPAVLVLGTAYKIIDTGKMIQLPATNEEAKIISIMHVPVAHPTVFIRSTVFKKYGLAYNKKYEPAEDYDLWTRVLEFGNIENLPVPLLLYRQHAAQQSISKYDALIEAAAEIRLRQLNKIISFINKPYDILFAIDVLTMKPFSLTGPGLKKFALLLSDMEQGNSSNKIYDEALLKKYLRERWLFYVEKFNNPAVKDIPLLLLMRRSQITRMGWRFNLKYLLKLFSFH